MRIRNRKMKAQNGLCYYCAQPMWLQDIRGFCRRHGLDDEEAHRLKCTAEHLIARTDGGLDTDPNIVAACHYCNQARHDGADALSPKKFSEHVRGELKEGQWHRLRLQP